MAQSKLPVAIPEAFASILTMPSAPVSLQQTLFPFLLPSSFSANRRTVYAGGILLGSHVPRTFPVRCYRKSDGPSSRSPARYFLLPVSFLAESQMATPGTTEMEARRIPESRRTSQPRGRLDTSTANESGNRIGCACARRHRALRECERCFHVFRTSYHQLAWRGS